jgi:hypothetical protein
MLLLSGAKGISKAGPEPHKPSGRPLALLDPASRTVLGHAVSIRGPGTWFAV